MNALHEPADDLITGFLRQSYAGAVRQRLLAIERAVQSGQRHELIVRELEQFGMTASLGTFRKSLSRARIWWRKQLMIQAAHFQANESDKGLGNDTPVRGHAHHAEISQPNADQTAVEKPRAARLTDVTHGHSGDRNVPIPRSPAVAGRVDLDQFFKPKSVFAKT